VGADGKDLFTAASQNQFFAVGLARYHAAFAEIANRKSISEIGFVCLCHDLPPEPFDTKMLAVVEPMVSVHTTRELRKFSQTSQRLQLISRPATWARSHLAHRGKSCITIQSRYAGRESVAR
jgi:hypothetical protein